MLSRLSVRNYALIRELDFTPGEGLTIITGETGAGKSILLGALSLILGNRSDTSVLLDKGEKCIVEGSFSLNGMDLKDFFSVNDLDYEEIATLRREINPAGKSRAFINDTPVPLALMKELGDRLIDIHSQHQTLMLQDNAFQLAVIDSFAGTSELLVEYGIALSAYRKLQKEHSLLKEKTLKNAGDLEYYSFQLSQLKEAKLVKGEQEDLEKEQEVLEHAADIRQALETSSDLLSGDETGSVLGRIREIRSLTGKIYLYLPAGEELQSRIDSVAIELDDIASEVEKLCSGFEADPRRLEWINERLDQIYSLVQKHRVRDLEELLSRQEEIERLIVSIVSGDESLERIETLLREKEKNLRKLSSEISSERRKTLTKIEEKVTGILRQLGMPNARFRVTLSGTTDFTPAGTDSADFLFSANKQVEPENLARIASGGELSRVMLSLKSLLSRNKNLPTIIFDEIDSGVSGEVADKVGQILSGMGTYMQVVNITHLPQVASRGQNHYHVYKEDTGDSTLTRIKLLTPDERVTEVARLLSGSEVTEIAIRNAKELLGTK